ncbi:hypothetical protein [Roseixanthobacter glucoisosaccharinicivorans]|uniref:hypothetical protein n=1 Tax=Roseixanthobacter glucoisosaccharinicivorans TaxID=3119923 RepID=UPI0037290357
MAQRQSALVDQQIQRPFPKIVSAQGNASPTAVLNLALAELWHRDDGVANQRLGELLQTIRQQKNYKGVTGHHQPGALADDDLFHFQWAQFLYRIHAMYGPAGSVRQGAVTQAIDDQIRDVFIDWSSTECRIADANPSRTWIVWGSENHSALRDSSCWAAASIIMSSNSSSGAYQDGSTAAQQLTAWSNFLKAYFKSRGRTGALIEYFSPTYAQYTLLNFYLYADFAEDENLRDLARSYLDLWWAMWAQEEIDGIHGGSKTRTYASRLGDGTPLPVTAWLYFGIGARPTELPPGEASMVASAYRPPAAVSDLVLHRPKQAKYEVRTRAPGLSATPRSPGFLYDVDFEKNGVLRVTHVTPGFAMGLGMLPLLPDKAWTAISSQNRWSGLVFGGGDRLARIVPSVILPADRKSYNAQFGVQSAATQLVRGVFSPKFRAPHKMGVFFGKPLRRFEQGDWIFVDAAAYAAVRPAFGGWQPDPKDAHWMVLNDPRSAVIIQAADKDEYPNLSAFISAVTAMPISVSATTVAVTGLGTAGKLTLGLGDDGTMMINDRPVDLQPPFVLKSPFINQELGSGRIIIKNNDRTLELNFESPGR